MGRKVVRAAAYLPRFTDGRRRVGAPDEDAFTFAATALEQALPRDPPDARAQRVTTLGAGAPLDPSALAALLGAPVLPGPWGPEEPSLSAALEEAAHGSGPAWIVAVSWYGAASAQGPAGPPGEGAVALLIDDGPGASLPSLGPSTGAGRHGESAYARLHAFGHARPGPTVWAGNWDADPAVGRAAPPRPPARPGPPEFTVSQGAFVPPARYDESRPSRWRFVADRCGACGGRTFPSRGRCGRCGGSGALRPEPLPLGGATVLAVTWIGQGGQPTEFDGQVEMSGPYGVVLAEVAPDVRVTLTVTEAGPEEVRIGSKVDTGLRRLYPIEGAWRYGRKALPTAQDR